MYIRQGKRGRPQRRSCLTEMQVVRGQACTSSPGHADRPDGAGSPTPRYLSDHGEGSPGGRRNLCQRHGPTPAASARTTRSNSQLWGRPSLAAEGGFAWGADGASVCGGAGAALDCGGADASLDLDGACPLRGAWAVKWKVPVTGSPSAEVTPPGDGVLPAGASAFRRAGPKCERVGEPVWMGPAGPVTTTWRPMAMGRSSKTRTTASGARSTVSPSATCSAGCSDSQLGEPVDPLSRCCFQVQIAV